jgi:putative Mn2+ efflux pump MntP
VGKWQILCGINNRDSFCVGLTTGKFSVGITTVWILCGINNRDSFCVGLTTGKFSVGITTETDFTVGITTGMILLWE